jgi:F-type H+-transporting ATPase subunit c
MDISAMSLGAGLAVGLAGAGVAMGQGRLAGTSIEMMGNSPKMANSLMVYTILGIALVESAVINGLVVAFQIKAVTGATEINVIGAGLAIGLAGFGAGYGEGHIISAALIAMNRNPEMKDKILQFMVLFVALAETSAIYGLVIAFKLLNG